MGFRAVTKDRLPDLWSQVAEMGFTATAIPEEYGGLGLGYLELCVIAEELGRSLAPTPFSSSVYLATESILQLYQFYFQQYSQSLLLGLTSLNIFLVKSDLKVYG